ncbi:MAG TPA: chlorohydrolase, partial [Candidatus Cloacimonetes bacterium]|nr:chlorohydrolase [Candidatus Cloacimonadota bacterium]
MKFKVNSCIFNSDKVISGIEIELKSKLLKKEDAFFDCSDKFSYPPFINGHDHLIGNWYPRSGDNRPYPNSDVWVEDMKNSKSYLERNKVWINDGKFDLTKGTANLLTSLGIYKNIFSGCHAVQDHGPNQIDEYYEQFPINVIREYRQCHSIELGNWWGGKSAKEEWEDTKGQMPFIIHLAESSVK